MDVSRVTTQGTGGDFEGGRIWRSGSEDFYRDNGVADIKARVKGNALEQNTYVLAVNHEMDEIHARVMGSGGVLNEVDRARLGELATQMKAVSDDNPDAPEFQNHLQLAVDRASKVDLAIAWTSKSAAQIKGEIQADTSKKYDYLTSLDDRRALLSDELSGKASRGELTHDDLAVYDQITRQITDLKQNNPFFGGPEAEEFDAWLQARLDQYTADKSHFATQVPRE